MNFLKIPCFAWTYCGGIRRKHDHEKELKFVECFPHGLSSFKAYFCKLSESENRSRINLRDLLPNFLAAAGLISYFKRYIWPSEKKGIIFPSDILLKKSQVFFVRLTCEFQLRRLSRGRPKLTFHRRQSLGCHCYLITSLQSS